MTTAASFGLPPAATPAPTERETAFECEELSRRDPLRETGCKQPRPDRVHIRLRGETKRDRCEPLNPRRDHAIAELQALDGAAPDTAPPITGCATHGELLITRG